MLGEKIEIGTEIVLVAGWEYTFKVPSIAGDPAYVTKGKFRFWKREGGIRPAKDGEHKTYKIGVKYPEDAVIIVHEGGGSTEVSIYWLQSEVYGDLTKFDPMG